MLIIACEFKRSSHATVFSNMSEIFTPSPNPRWTLSSWKRPHRNARWAFVTELIASLPSAGQFIRSFRRKLAQ